MKRIPDIIIEPKKQTNKKMKKGLSHKSMIIYKPIIT